MTSLFLDDDTAKAMILTEVLKADVELAGQKWIGDDPVNWEKTLPRINRTRRRVFELLGEERLETGEDPK